MSGSDMGTLVAGFAKFFCFVIAAVLGVIALFTTGAAQATLLVLCLFFAAAALLLRFLIRRKENAYYAERAEMETAARAYDPYYDAYCRFQEALREAGIQGSYSTGQGREDGQDVLFFYVNTVDKWDGDSPIIVNGLPFAELKAKIPTAVNASTERREFPVCIKVLAKPPAN